MKYTDKKLDRIPDSLQNLFQYAVLNEKNPLVVFGLNTIHGKNSINVLNKHYVYLSEKIVDEEPVVFYDEHIPPCNISKEELISSLDNAYMSAWQLITDQGNLFINAVENKENNQYYKEESSLKNGNCIWKRMFRYIYKNTKTLLLIISSTVVFYIMVSCIYYYGDVFFL